MPKLSEEAMETRRQHILEAAARCFADKGYRATSIPDICKAAGVSVGAVYTHYPSKEAIVEAMAEASMRERRTSFEGTDGDHTLRQASYLLDLVEALYGEGGARLARLDLDLWSESTRNPALRASVTATFAQLARQIEEAVKRSQAAGEIDGRVPARGAAHVLLAIGLGLEVQRALDVAPAARTAQRTLRALLAGIWG